VDDEDDGELKTKAKAKKATVKKSKAAVAEPEVKSAPKKGAVPRVPKK